MIVRISGEGQFRMESKHLDHLNEIDNKIVEAVARDDEGVFCSLFAELVAYIREQGAPVAAEEIITSDVVLPPTDTTLAEARELFVGEGVLPG